jgi:subtilisin family serine protease
MSLHPVRTLALVVAVLVLIVGGGIWITSRPTPSGIESSTDASTFGTDPSTTTTEVGKTSQSSEPVDPTDVAPRIAPRVEADIAAAGQTEVLVVFDAQLSGSDDEKRAQVQAGIDAITSSLPTGSWSVLGGAPTVPVANLVIDQSALLVLQQRADIKHVNSALDEFFPAEVSYDVSSSSDLGASANTETMGAAGMDGAWAAGFRGAGTTIAVIDTGVQTDHPFLMRGSEKKTVGEACFAAYPGYTSSCPGGSPMTTTEPSKVGAGAPCPVDIITNGQKECAHGTHVSGIAAGGDGTGVSGIAPDASLIAIQVFSYSYSTNRIAADTGDLNSALEWLYNRRADFPGLVSVNMSVGDGRKYTNTASCDAAYPSTKFFVQQLLNVGIATVVAAGNNGWTDGVSAPGCLSNVVTVSALTAGSGADQRATYSNVGQPEDLNHPYGFNILFAPGTFNSSVPCDGYGFLNGTSMATPAVAGSIAVLRQTTVADSFDLLRSTGAAVPGFGPPSVKLKAAIASLPGPPRSVMGNATGTQVAVSWLAPNVNAGTVTDYRVTALPGGATCSTVGLSCTVTGLNPTASYVFTVQAIGTGGIGAGASTAPIPMPNVPAVPTDYVPLNPVRLLDTRSVSTGASTIDGNDLGCGPVGQQQVRTLMVEGRGGVPAVGVDAVAVNVTVVSPTASNFLTVYPNGTARPDTSTINFVAGQTIPNMAIVKVGADGRIAIFNAQGSTQVVIDVVGWFPDGSDYTGVIPQRLLDTRTAVEGGGGTIDGAFRGIGSVGQGQTLVLPVIGRGTIPASGVGAVALNVTAVSPTASNFLTVYPSGTALPNASNLNFVAGQTIANMVIAKVGVDGNVAIYNAQGTTQVVVDIIGWFPTISEYTGIVPERFLDTRTCDGCLTFDDEYVGIGPLGPSVSLPLQITGRGSIPSSGVGSVALNVTVAGSSASGYLTVYPSGATLPTASNLNFLPGQIVPNMVIVKLGGDGQIAIFNSSGLTSVVVDVVGWFPS